MKPLQYITALILTIALILVLFATNHAKTNTDTSKIKISFTGQIEPVKVEYGELLERLEELARENLLLEQENNDLKHQAEAFGWLKKSMDKEGVNP